jgi:predicted MFS family arabinose efflux permease
MLLAVSSGILNALLLPYLEGELGLGSAQFGLILSAGAATGAVTAIYFSKKQDLNRPLYLVAAAGFLAGAALFALVLAFDLVTVMLSLAMIGAVDVILNIPLSVLMQKLVEDKLRGRVFALLNVAFTAIQVVGMGIGGVWAEVAGSTGPPMIGAAIGLIVVSLIGFIAVSALNLHSRLETPVQEENQSEEEVHTEEILVEVHA